MRIEGGRRGGTCSGACLNAFNGFIEIGPNCTVTASGSQKRDAPLEHVPQVVEHLFRHEAGKLVSRLTSIFGFDHLNLAEDLVQEALARALQTWPYYGVPKNPAAWIMQVSKNLAIDFVRREKVFRDKEIEIIGSLEQHNALSNRPPSFAEEIQDDSLRMMFVCCHPIIPREAQVALALKILCGFSPAEIGKALLASESAVAKKLTRAKEKIREAEIPFAIPSGKELSERLDGVLQTLYLLFNEGYKASSGPRLIREELCHEAIRLTSFLIQNPMSASPKVHALLALMLFNAARLATRLDHDGNILLLREQDRSRWNGPMIARGMFHLSQSAAGDEITEYHLQAGIAACHCAAEDYESTDWPNILSLYDSLVQVDDSPVVALNRAVAVAKVRGVEAGIEAVAQIRNRAKLDSYYLLYAVMGEFEAQLNHRETALAYLNRALELADTKSERRFLAKKLQEERHGGKEKRRRATDATRQPA
jgi:RNA polymerase sigma factor (sigma-70 family)